MRSSSARRWLLHRYRGGVYLADELPAEAVESEAPAEAEAPVEAEAPEEAPAEADAAAEEAVPEDAVSDEAIVADEGSEEPVGEEAFVDSADLSAEEPFITDESAEEATADQAEIETDIRYLEDANSVNTGLKARPDDYIIKSGDDSYIINIRDFDNTLTVETYFSVSESMPDMNVTYQWYDPKGKLVRETKDVPAGSDTLNDVDLNQGYNWKCVVTDSYNNFVTVRMVVSEPLALYTDTYNKYASPNQAITLDPFEDQYGEDGAALREQYSDYTYEWTDVDDTVLSDDPTCSFKIDQDADNASVYCQVTNEYGATVTIDYIVHNADKMKAAALPLTFGGDPVQVSLGAGETKMLSFTAPASGRYEFDANSGDDTCAKLFDSEMQYVDEYDDPRGDDTGLDFGFSRDLVQGQTCYLVVRFYDKDTEGDFTVSVKKHTHRWIADEDNYPATCGKDGYSLFICATCDDASETHPKATGRHTWVWSTVRNATALQAGLRTAKCKVCGGTTNAAIPKLTPTVTLNAYSVPLKVKQRSQVITASGFAAGDYVRSWTSSNSKVVKATPAGNSVVLKAGKKLGKAVITVTLASGKTAQLTVKVQKKKVTTKRINIKTAKKLTLTRGSKVSIGASVTPITSPEKLKYKSSKKKVASVSKQGVITAKKKGKAVITVQSGKKKIKIQVTVK